MLVSCRQDRLPADPAADPTADAISFEIVLSAPSRVATDDAFASTWEEGDAIGIFAVKHATGSTAPLATDGSNYINNARLTYTAGKWTPDPGTELWWADDGDVLDFYAYYPYTAGTTNPAAIAFAVPADQNGTAAGSGRPAYNATDILAAAAPYNGTVGYAKGITVTLPFRHVLAMVQVTVDLRDPDRNPSALADLTVTLLGCRPDGTLDLTSGTATTLADNNANPVAPVVMYRSATPADASTAAFTFRALVPPQSIAAGSRSHVIRDGDENYPADILTSPLVLTGGKVTRFINTIDQRGIRSAADLVAFSAAWNDAADDAARADVIARWSDEGTPDGTVYLHEDIDMSTIPNFTPIGKDQTHPFTGTFDGGGHTISNLTVNVDETVSYAGLFGRNGGTIRHVKMKDGNIHGAGYGVAGNIAGVNKYGTITGCSVTGGTTVNINAGGIAGHNTDGSITGCSVTGGTITGNLAAGGIAGDNSGGSITGCIAAPAEVKGTTNTGICAGTNGSTSTITACYCGEITGIYNVGFDLGTTDCTSFDKADAETFFTAGTPSPVERMNTALEAVAAPVRWTAGNATTNWYPVIIEN